MFELDETRPDSKAELYASLSRQLEALLSGERDAIANLGNAASLIFHLLPGLNWAGFYRITGKALKVRQTVYHDALSANLLCKLFDAATDVLQIGFGDFWTRHYDPQFVFSF